jgi:hypothetical protein
LRTSYTESATKDQHPQTIFTLIHINARHVLEWTHRKIYDPLIMFRVVRLRGPAGVHYVSMVVDDACMRMALFEIRKQRNSLSVDLLEHLRAPCLLASRPKSDEHDIPPPILQPRCIQILKVDGLLLQFTPIRGEVGFCCDAPAIFTDFGPFVAGEELAEEFFSCCACCAENEGGLA